MEIYLTVFRVLVWSGETELLENADLMTSNLRIAIQGNLVFT